MVRPISIGINFNDFHDTEDIHFELLEFSKCRLYCEVPLLPLSGTVKDMLVIRIRTQADSTFRAQNMILYV